MEPRVWGAGSGENMLARATEWVVTGEGNSPLDSLVEQLWRTPVSSGAARVVVDALPDERWQDAETYWLLPSLARPSLLIPRGTPVVTSASLRSYRTLRPPKVQFLRNALGLVARSGLPPSLHRVSVQKPVGAPAGGGPSTLPLEAVTRVLGQQHLYAAIGIRLGDNRKPTLQLFDDGGRPAGYAKLAWNETSRDFILTETAALAALEGSAGPTRSPRLLGTGSRDGFPFLITEPLPGNVRAVRGRVARPTPEELFSLCPVTRTDHIPATGHFQELSRRLRKLPDAGEHRLRVAAQEAEGLIRARNARVPVAQRWHGDLVPWNTAREPSGALWCWDWESAEPDAVAGLDALHWTISVRREAGTGTMAGNLTAALADSAGYLAAAGLPASAHGDVAAVYALVVAERAWTLAANNGGWSSSWISQEDLLELLRTAVAHLL